MESGCSMGDRIAIPLRINGSIMSDSEDIKSIW